MPNMTLEEVGQVIRFFARSRAAAVMLVGSLQVGDWIYVRGYTSDFQQRVELLQVQHVPVTRAEAGQTVGIRTVARCRKHDLIYKLVTKSD